MTSKISGNKWGKGFGGKAKRKDVSVTTNEPDAVTASTDGDTTAVHVNVEDSEPRRSRFVTAIVGALGAASALIAGLATASVSASSSNTASSLDSLAQTSENRFYYETTLAHQEQVLPVRMELSDPETYDDFDLVTLTFSNPGATALTNVEVEIPEGSLLNDATTRSNRLHLGVIPAGGEHAEKLLVPKGKRDVKAQFSTAWDGRETWWLAADSAPEFQSCTFTGGEGGHTTVNLTDIEDALDWEWLSCDAVFDELDSGWLDSPLDSASDLAGSAADAASNAADAASNAADAASNAAAGASGESAEEPTTPRRSRIAIADAQDLAAEKTETLTAAEVAELLPGGNPLAK